MPKSGIVHQIVQTFNQAPGCASEVAICVRQSFALTMHNWCLGRGYSNDKLITGQTQEATVCDCPYLGWTW